MSENPWKTLSQKYVYEFPPFLRLREDQIILPNGEQAKYIVGERNDFSVIIAQNKEKKIVLVNQFRYALKRRFWELPMGGVNDNEEPKTAAKRELEEETGFRAGKLEKIGAAFVGPGLLKNKGHVFFAEELTKGKRNLESGEQGMKVEWFTVAEIDALINKGELQCGPSLSAWLFFKNFNKDLGK